MKKLLFILFTLALSGCSEKSEEFIETTPTSETLFVKFADKRFNLAVEKDRISAAVHFLNKEEKGAEILSSEVQKFTPKKGDDFDGLFVQYKLGDEYVKMVIPFNLESTPNGRVYLAEDCTMKCKASTFCYGCTITIEEKCKKVACDCNRGGGDCSPEVTFPTANP